MEVRHETERPLLTKRNENFCKCICISINNIDQKFSFTFGSHYNLNENVLIWIMLRSCVRARWDKSASALSVEAATVSSVAQGRRTPPARRSLSFFQDSTLRALLPVLKEAARPQVSTSMKSITRSEASA